MERIQEQESSARVSPCIVPFRRVVEKQPPFQVCRTFLSMLQLVAYVFSPSFSLSPIPLHAATGNLCFLSYPLFLLFIPCFFPS
jgi:hypothetical protein